VSPRSPNFGESSASELEALVDLIAAREGKNFSLQFSQSLAVNSPARHVAEKRKRSRPLSLFVRGTDKTGTHLLQEVSQLILFLGCGRRRGPSSPTCSPTCSPPSTSTPSTSTFCTTLSSKNSNYLDMWSLTHLFVCRMHRVEVYFAHSGTKHSPRGRPDSGGRK